MPVLSYIVCKNEEGAKRVQTVREEIVSELQERIAKSPKKMIGNTGYRRYPSVEKDAVQINEEKIDSEKKFDWSGRSPPRQPCPFSRRLLS